MNSFRMLREALFLPPVLSLTCSYFTYVFDTVDCDKQLGAVLMQRFEERSLRPNSYVSRTLTATERNHNTTERDCLSIFCSILIFRPYLVGTRFEIRNERDSLRCHLSINTTSGRLAIRKLHLQQFNSIIIYWARMKPLALDRLSRLERTGQYDFKFGEDIPFMALTKADTKSLETLNENDPDSHRPASYTN